MALRQVRVCDVHANQGKSVEATTKVTVTLPSIVVGGRKARALSVDVCRSCKTTVEKMERTALAGAIKAFEPLTSLDPTFGKDKPADPSASDSGVADDASSQTSSDTDHGE